MPQTTVTKSQKSVIGSSGHEYEVEQYTTTIPKALAEAMGLDGGEQIDWNVLSQNALRATFADE